MATALVLVTHPVLSSPSAFVVEPKGFGNRGDDAYASVYYTEASCAGTPYLSEQLGGYVHVEGTMAYPRAGQSTSIAVVSIESDDVDRVRRQT